MQKSSFTLLPLVFALAACAPPVVEEVDAVLRNGRIYDGSGAPPAAGGLAIDGGRLVAVGDVDGYAGREEIDVGGLAVAPGFINTLSQSHEALIEDGRGLSDVLQGVTLEVQGEASMGPFNAKLRQAWLDYQTDIRYDIPWSTLGGYLEWLEKRGLGPNVAAFVSVGTLRDYVDAYNREELTPEEIVRMRDLVREAVEEGALGVTSALGYVPDNYFTTAELVALASVAGEYGCGFVAHMRDEGVRHLEAVDEIIQIARDAGVWVQIYHYKVKGRSHWPILEESIARINAARAEGLDVTADIYPYLAGLTVLSGTLPRWVKNAGYYDWVEQLKEPAVRERLRKEIENPTEDWESRYYTAGGPENILLMRFRNEALRSYIGKTLAEVAQERGTSPIDTIFDLLIEDEGRPEAAYFMMSEENLRRKLGLPWVAIGSDAAPLAPEGVFLNSRPHPRAYGSFARVLGRFVRDEGVTTLADAIRRMTSLPAEAFKLRDRGRLKEGFHADVVVFDPATVQDHATYADPHRFATGIHHVLVNGTFVVRDGEPSGATPGQIVRGPGWTGWD